MMRRVALSGIQAAFALVALSLLPLGASQSAPPSPALPSCPIVLPAPNALPKGARLLGSKPTGTPLHFVSMTDQSPAQVRPDGDYLAEIESEVDDRPGVRRASTWFDSTTNPVSLVCRYGGFGRPAEGTAMLLVPLPANVKGECVVASLLRNGGQHRPRVTCARVRH